MAIRWDIRNSVEGGIYISFDSEWEAKSWMDRNQTHPHIKVLKIVEKEYESFHEKYVRIENERDKLINFICKMISDFESGKRTVIIEDLIILVEEIKGENYWKEAKGE